VAIAITGLLLPLIRAPLEYLFMNSIFSDQMIGLLYLIPLGVTFVFRLQLPKIRF
jgi:hypothetical protein